MPPPSLRSLSQNLMIRKCEDVETKNSSWARKHNLDYKLATWQNHQTPSFLKDTDKDLIHIPKLVLLEMDSSR